MIYGSNNKEKGYIFDLSLKVINDLEKEMKSEKIMIINEEYVVINCIIFSNMLSMLSVIL